jgi:hypothetical protein
MHNFNFDKFKHYNANKHLMKHKSQTFNLQKQKPSISKKINKKIQPLRTRK